MSQQQILDESRQNERDVLAEELERRIDEIERLDVDDFGRFTKLDWFLCVTGAVVLPILAAWWAR